MNDSGNPFVYGIMISQVWPKACEKEGETLRAFETALGENFFQSYQTVQIESSRERRHISSLMKPTGYPVTYCLTRVLNQNGINLSNLNQRERKNNLGLIERYLEQAKEVGAGIVSFVSGKRSGAMHKRADELKTLKESLFDITEIAHYKFNNLKVEIEPLDFNSHKQFVLGTVEEGVEIVREIRKDFPNIYLCIDTSHMYLNGENPIKAYQLSCNETLDFHFCNCVTDKLHPLFGDHHIKFGEPGVLGIHEMSSILSGLEKVMNENSIQQLPVFCEVFKKEDMDSYELLKYCRDSLSKAVENR